MNRFEKFLPAVCVVFVTALVWHYVWMSGDGWWYLALGRDIAAKGGLPEFNDLAFTGHWTRVLHQQWLPYVLFYGAFNAVGYTGVYLLNALLIAGGISLTWRSAKLRGASAPIWILFAATGVFFMRLDISVRSESIAVLLFGIVALLFDDDSEKSKPPYWLLAPAFIVWANTHSSLPLAIAWPIMIMTGRYLDGLSTGVKPKLVRPAAWLMAATALTLLNPYGLGVYTDIAARLASRSVNIIEIFKSPDFSDPYNVMEAVWIGAAWLGIFLSSKRPKIADMLVASAVSLMFLNGQRYFVFAMLGLLPISAASWETILNRWTSRPSLKYATAAICLAGALYFAIAPRKHVNVEANVDQVADRLEASGIKGRVFNYYTWGGFLLWEHPSLEIFIDGRNNIYEPSRVFDDYILAARGGRYYEEIFSMYGVDIVIWPTYETNLFGALSGNPAWKTVVVVGDAVVFARKTASDARTEEGAEQ